MGAGLSAWGKSWGVWWGNSWGEVSSPPAFTSGGGVFRHYKQWRDAIESELPPKQEEVAQEAVREAVDTSIKLSKKQIDHGKALLQIMEARRRFEEAYADAFKAHYVAEYVAEYVAQQWVIETERRRKRVAAFLLLH